MRRVRDTGFVVKAMHELDLTFDDYASRCGVTTSAMWKRVHGQVCVDEVDARRMARVLGVPVSIVFDVERRRRTTSSRAAASR